MSQDLAKSSMYTVNNTGDKTEPCTKNSKVKLNKKLSYRREAARAACCCVFWLVAEC